MIENKQDGEQVKIAVKSSRAVAPERMVVPQGPTLISLGRNKSQRALGLLLGHEKDTLKTQLDRNADTSGRLCESSCSSMNATRIGVSGYEQDMEGPPGS